MGFSWIAVRWNLNEPGIFFGDFELFFPKVFQEISPFLIKQSENLQKRL
jgi:hypothetical protein